MQEPRVTEIKVRIDCNGCVQKIKKALHGINGINDVYIDVLQQKLTINGWANPEKIVKALKKTRKLATIVSETQLPSDPETVLPTESPKEPENPPPEPDQPEPEPEPEPPSRNSTRPQSPQMSRPEEAEEVHVVHHYPPDHNHRRIHERASMEHYSSPLYKHEPQSVEVKHNYNAFKHTPYVTDYKYIPSPPQNTHSSGSKSPQQFTHYNTPQHYTHYSRAEPPPQQTHFTRPEPPQTHFTIPEPPQTHFTRPEPPQTHFTIPEPPPRQKHYTEPPQHYTHYNRPEPPPQQVHFTIPEPPQTHFTNPETPAPQKHYIEPPKHYTHYNRPEPPPQQTHFTRPEPPQTRFSRPKPPQTHFTRPEPPLHYTHYNKPEPPEPSTNYGQAEPRPQYTNYSGEYHSSSNGNGNIMSIFSDDNPNACTIV
ncbi:hypothetical protein SSX86_004406 [Deinandra increscens subsp. villosa]|uniref:HMA domain-containing protein n=1 Tax=Deinandra increscens subsp. villosa TaxID=3103831 RepID=A0AAP0DS15_9ASTR